MYLNAAGLLGPPEAKVGAFANSLYSDNNRGSIFEELKKLIQSFYAIVWPSVLAAWHPM